MEVAVAKSTKSEIPIYLYVPNLIGYLRLILVILAGFFSYDWRVFIPCYLVSFTLDFFDGFFARKLQQTSQFGALLDMFVDRGSITTLFCVLSSLYPQLSLVFILFAFFDITSHLVRVYYTLYAGKTSHKQVDRKSTPLPLYLYYTNRIFMGFLCIGHEIFFCLLYLLFFVNFLPASYGRCLSIFLNHAEWFRHYRPDSLEGPLLKAVPSMSSAYAFPSSSSISSPSSSDFDSFGRLVSQKYFGYFLPLMQTQPVVAWILTVLFSVALPLALMKGFVHFLQLGSGMKDMMQEEEKKTV